MLDFAAATARLPLRCALGSRADCARNAHVVLELSRRTIGEFLAEHGADSFPVMNAVDALRVLAQEVPDAIFLDIKMPGLSGLDALPAIRAEK